jgi:hypothetical protein
MYFKVGHGRTQNCHLLSILVGAQLAPDKEISKSVMVVHCHPHLRKLHSEKGIFEANKFLLSPNK